MSLSPGSMLGPYRIIERVGKGGMATVYKAYQPALDRYVALKVLPESLAEDADFRRRFEQEAKAIARLRHPSIVAVHDFGTHDGIAYIVTELIEGGTLADRLGKPLPVSEVVAVLAPIASALDYAHARGVLHRDVKPSNILLAADGTTVLSDFGLAKMLEADNQLTRASAIIGTPQYMAPEQCEGAPPAAAADVYSLAVVAYEMLTGRPPFVAETPAAVILAQIQGELPPPRQLNPQLSPAVEAVLLKGLARNPDDRYPKCTAFIGALAQSDKATPAVLPPPRPAPVPAARGPLPVPALAAGLVTILLIAAIAAGAVLFGGGRRAAGPAGPVGVTASSTSTPTASPSPLPPQRLEADLPDARQEAAAAAVGDTLYVMGGLDASAKSLDAVDVYAKGAWQTGPKLPLGLDHAAAAVLNGQLYLAAGYSAGKAGAGAFRLNGSAWQALAPLHHARGALALIALGARLYAIGGESGGTQVAATETYDPAANAWTDLPALPQPRNHLAGFLYHNLACVAGGRPPETTRVDCYDPAAGAWSALPSLPTATSGAGAGSFGDEVVVTGGENTIQNVLVDQLARLTESGWRAGPMQVPRHGIAMALLGGRLWACGGGTAVGLHPVPTCTSIGPGGA